MKILKLAKQPFHIINFRSAGRNGSIERRLLPFYNATVDALPNGMTCFVATSDLQGRMRVSNCLLGEAVAEELQLMQDLKEIPPVNAILLAGDFYDYPEQHKRGGTGDVTGVVNSFATAASWVFFVYGNHDTLEEDQLHKNVRVLDGQNEGGGDFKVGGVSGIIGKTDRNQRKTEQDFMSSLKKVLKQGNHINLMHQGPDDPKGKQQGSPAVREGLEKYGDSLVFFGHREWQKPLRAFGKNQALNLDSKVFVFTAAKA